MFASAAYAHDVMGTLITVEFGRETSQLELEIPFDELRLAFGLKSSPGVVEPPASESELIAYVRAHLQVKTSSRLALEIAPQPTLVHDDRNWARFRIEVPASDFTIQSDLVTHQVVSHRIYVFVREEGAAPKLIDTLHYQRHVTHVAGTPRRSAIPKDAYLFASLFVAVALAWRFAPRGTSAV
ncbi:MAG: hypothetical protein QM817_24935 [Archangium sp.]